MIDASQIQEHAEVVGSCGNHVGVVDKVEGERIKLTKASDPHGQGHHHFLPLSAISKVEGGKVMTTMNHLAAIKMLESQDA